MRFITIEFYGETSIKDTKTGIEIDCYFHKAERGLSKDERETYIEKIVNALNAGLI